MRGTAWRPSTAPRKRRGAYLSLLDASGVAAIFFFLMALYLMRHLLVIDKVQPVDLAAAAHANPLPAALKEDAIKVSVSRDGGLYFGDNRVLAEDLPELIRNAYTHGSERKVYLKADARAKYADVKIAIEQIRQSGIQEVALITEEARQPNR